MSEGHIESKIHRVEAMATRKATRSVDTRRHRRNEAKRSGASKIPKGFTSIEKLCLPAGQGQPTRLTAPFLTQEGQDV